MFEMDALINKLVKGIQQESPGAIVLIIPFDMEVKQMWTRRDGAFCGFKGFGGN